MSWIVRSVNKPKVPAGRVVPDYASGSGNFTIRMYHSGSFLHNVGRTTYFGGGVAHIDFCNSDEMSMLEINYMAAEIGFLGDLVFHFSVNGVDDCISLRVMSHDMDALNLINSMVGIYVEHKNSRFRQTQIQTQTQSSIQTNSDVLPEVTERMEFLEDDATAETIAENETLPEVGQAEENPTNEQNGEV